MSRDNLSIAVIIVNYNGGEFIEECLSALLAQWRRPDRILVVDNNSDDGSNLLISQQFSEVELIQLDKNTGFAGANNHGFRQLDPDQWVALLNPDTVPDQNWLLELENSVVENPQCDIFASKLMSIDDPQRIDGAGDIYHVSGLCWRRHHGLIESKTLRQDDPVFSGCGAATLYRLDSINQVGGFDESYFCYYEDIDLVFRMRLMGSNCCYVDRSIVHHHGSGVTGRDSDFSIYHGHRNLVWTYVKNMPGIYFYLYLPGHLILNLISLLHYTVQGRAGVIFKAKWHALKRLPGLLRQRKAIQSMRRVKPRVVTKYMVKGVLRPYFFRFR